MLMVSGLVFSGPVYAADEVVISERELPRIVRRGQLLNIHGPRVSSYSVDIGTGSEALAPAGFESDTAYIMICNNAGAAIWYNIGASTISANANTFGNEYLPSSFCREEPVRPGQFISTAADS